MRSVIICLVSVIVIILIWFGFYYYSIEDTYLYYWNELEGLTQIVNEQNWDEANLKMSSYMDKWESTRKLWIYFLNQHHVNEIDITINRLNKYIKEKETPLSLAQIEELKYRFKIVKEGECLTLENIF